MISEIAKDLARIVGEENVSTKESDITIYSRDVNPRNLILLKMGVLRTNPVDVIVWPENISHVVSIAKYCNKMGINLVAYGGGTGAFDQNRSAKETVIIDLKKLNSISDVDTYSQTVQVQAGVIGRILEDSLNMQGWTTGNLLLMSGWNTIGGFIASRGGTLFSPFQETLEDAVLKIKIVTKDGEIEEFSQFQTDEFNSVWIGLFTGSEGKSGIIVEALLRVYPIPMRKTLILSKFPSFSYGINCMQEIEQSMIFPSLLILHDFTDSFLQYIFNISNYQPLRDIPEQIEEKIKIAGLTAITKYPKISALMINLLGGHFLSESHLLVGINGLNDVVESSMSSIESKILKYKGKNTGEEAGQKWGENFFCRPWIRNAIFASGGFGDEFRVWANWSLIEKTYKKITKKLNRHFVSSVFLSNSTAQGALINFCILGNATNEKEALKKYDMATKIVFEEANSCGAYPLVNKIEKTSIENLGYQSPENGSMVYLEDRKKLKSAYP